MHNERNGFQYDNVTILNIAEYYDDYLFAAITITIARQTRNKSSAFYKALGYKVQKIPFENELYVAIRQENYRKCDRILLQHSKPLSTNRETYRKHCLRRVARSLLYIFLDTLDLMYSQPDGSNGILPIKCEKYLCKLVQRLSVLKTIYVYSFALNRPFSQIDLMTRKIRVNFNFKWKTIHNYKHYYGTQYVLTLYSYLYETFATFDNTIAMYYKVFGRPPYSVAMFTDVELWDFRLRRVNNFSQHVIKYLIEKIAPIKLRFRLKVVYVQTLIGALIHAINNDVPIGFCQFLYQHIMNVLPGIWDTILQSATYLVKKIKHKDAYVDVVRHATNNSILRFKHVTAACEYGGTLLRTLYQIPFDNIETHREPREQAIIEKWSYNHKMRLGTLISKHVVKCTNM
jgi:hypothetical protein